MKKSTILDLFKGNTGCIETIHIPKNQTNIMTADETYKQLRSKLSEEDIELVDKFSLYLQADLVEEVDLYFVEGFKLGLRIGIESMDE